MRIRNWNSKKNFELLVPLFWNSNGFEFQIRRSLCWCWAAKSKRSRCCQRRNRWAVTLRLILPFPWRGLGWRASHPCSCRCCPTLATRLSVTKNNSIEQNILLNNTVTQLRLLFIELKSTKQMCISKLC